jgi:hypothetical protein
VTDKQSDTATSRGKEWGLRAEYAKSDKSSCRACETYIGKHELRLAFLIQGPYGPVPAWHHVNCFFEMYPEVPQTVEDFAGLVSLKDEDQQDLRQRIRALNKENARQLDKEQADEVLVSEKTNNPPVDPELLRKQSDALWTVKDGLETVLEEYSNKERKDVLGEILQQNGYALAERSEHTLFDVLSDALCFGRAEQCDRCKQSRLTWDVVRQCYRCPVTEAWGDCGTEKSCSDVQLDTVNLAHIPEGVDAKELKALQQHPLVKRTPRPSSVVAKKEDTTKPMTADTLRKKVKRSASDLDEDHAEEERQKRTKVTVKGRAAVDPDSDLVDTHHVVEHDGTVYSAILAASDVASGRNSFYKLQVLEGDWVYSDDPMKPNVTGTRRQKKSGQGSASYYVFRSWGRVGTNIGDSRLERCANRSEAMDRFCELYFEKTGNAFDAAVFEKKPRMFYPMELTAPSDEQLAAVESGRVVPGSKTQLPKETQSLLKMIFDVEAMRRAMLEMEIDLSKMPLGQISQQQIKLGFGILKEALQELQRDGVHQTRITALSNQFYTLIPHNFGTYGKMPQLDSVKMVRSKLDMLDTLQEIEVATSIIKLDTDARDDMDPYDVHYEALKNRIEPLPENDPMHGMIEEYVATTHGKTHSDYELVVQQVFKLDREGESERYEEMLKQDPALASNRKLLWHGSRLTNFVGILKQGLRIAPAEAPVTGYMFGKGSYFSDVVSKSANYCRATPKDPVGFLILSEVALGHMLEKTASDFIKTLPAGVHSVKGALS